MSKFQTVPIVCVGCVVFRDKDILLVKRAKEPYIGYWTLPGGKIELGETVHEALFREIKEECNIDIKIDKLIDVIDYLEKDATGSVRFHYAIIDYFATYVRGDIKAGSDVDDIGWFKIQEISSLRLPEITRTFFRKHFQLTFN